MNKLLFFIFFFSALCSAQPDSSGSRQHVSLKTGGKTIFPKSVSLDSASLPEEWINLLSNINITKRDIDWKRPIYIRFALSYISGVGPEKFPFGISIAVDTLRAHGFKLFRLDNVQARTLEICIANGIFPIVNMSRKRANIITLSDTSGNSTGKKVDLYAESPFWNVLRGYTRQSSVRDSKEALTFYLFDDYQTIAIESHENIAGRPWSIYPLPRNLNREDIFAEIHDVFIVLPAEFTGASFKAFLAKSYEQIDFSFKMPEIQEVKGQAR